MEEIRKPLFIISLTLFLLAIFLEIGANGLASFLSGIIDSDALKNASDQSATPGLAIGYLALFDGLFLCTILLVGASLFIPESVQGRIQGIITLIVSLVILIACSVLVFVAITKLIIMTSLLFAPIFGTIAYFALFASFPTNSARVILTTAMVFKIGFAATLIFAHQRFLQNKGLIILTLFSFLLGIIVSILQGIVPGFLVSITDAIAAIVIAIVALIWAVIYLVNAVISILRAIV